MMLWRQGASIADRSYSGIRFLSVHINESNPLSYCTISIPSHPCATVDVTPHSKCHLKKSACNFFTSLLRLFSGLIWQAVFSPFPYILLIFPLHSYYFINYFISVIYSRKHFKVVFVWRMVFSLYKIVLSCVWKKIWIASKKKKKKKRKTFWSFLNDSWLIYSFELRDKLEIFLKFFWLEKLLNMTHSAR